MPLAWILVGVGIILIAVTAVYVAAEFSLVTVDRVAVDAAAARGDRGAARISRALRSLATQLSGAQVGITITTLALGYVMEPSLARLLIGPLGELGLGPGAAEGTAITIALTVATVLSMVFGELVPKNLAIARPLPTARRVVGVNSATTAALRPLIWALNGMANGLVRLFGMEPAEELGSARSASELESLVRRSGARGSLADASARLVAHSLRFSSKQAYDVVTPRVDIVTVPASASAAEVIDAARATGVSRFPVMGRDIDDIVGLVHVKRAIAVPPGDRAATSVTDLMVRAPFVPGTVPLDELLALLRGRGLQMAIVLDEYGGTEGVVTIEDLVEELLGEITDEHDDEISRWSALPDGAIVLDAALRPDEIADFTGLLLPDPVEYETLAGLVTEMLDRIPQVGDTVTVLGSLRDEAMFRRAQGQGALRATDIDPAAAPRRAGRNRHRDSPSTATDRESAPSSEPGFDSEPVGGLARAVAVLLVVTHMDGRRVSTIEVRLGRGEQGTPGGVVPLDQPGAS